MRVLISGAGIAGPTLAYWLARYGMHPTLLEKAPQLRTGGYIIDFWGSGYDVAEQMGLTTQLESAGYHVQEVRFVGDDGKRVGGFETRVLSTMTGGRFVSLPRSELSAAIYRALPPSVERVFGDEILSLEDTSRGVDVRFAHAHPRSFDLVIGADGLHSRVRELAFGAQPRFEVYLGYKVAAVELVGYKPRDELVYMLYSRIGQQIGRFTMRGDRTLILFVYADQDQTVPTDPDEQKRVLRTVFGDGGWECKKILDAMLSIDELYFDRVSQIRMPHWTKGRIALIGDAAFCVSLLAGQGSALAMVAAYVLAGELDQARGDHVLAFERYEERLAAFITDKQKAAERFAGSFAPRSRLRVWLRNEVTKAMRIPFVARLAIGRSLADKIALPPYERSGGDLSRRRADREPRAPI